MASQHIDVSEQNLSQDEWWALFEELRLTQQQAYDEVGGSEAFLRRERDAGATGEDLRWALDNSPDRPPDPGDELEA